MKVNQLFNRKNVSGILGIIAVGLFFVMATILTNTYHEEIQRMVLAHGPLGMISYVLVTATAIVVAPISTLPLMPMAVGAWGWITAGFLSIVGWVLGSQIAFYLARKYGKVLIQKFVSLENVSRLEHSFPDKNIFWIIVLLRVTLPVDLLSYGLGLFSSVSHKTYFLATLIGVIPFAFVFSYVGSLPPRLQVITLIEIFLFVVIVYLVRKRL